eukprot:5314826-Prymnesium_polylepis.2
MIAFGGLMIAFAVVCLCATYCSYHAVCRASVNVHEVRHSIECIQHRVRFERFLRCEESKSALGSESR